MTLSLLYSTTGIPGISTKYNLDHASFDNLNNPRWPLHPFTAENVMSPKLAINGDG